MKLKQFVRPSSQTGGESIIPEFNQLLGELGLERAGAVYWSAEQIRESLPTKRGNAHS